MTEKQNLFRINSRIGQKQNEWLDKESAETGISKSAIMQMALDQYISTKETVSAMNNMAELFKKLETIEKELKDVKQIQK